MRRRGFCLGIMILLLAGVARAASEPIYDESVDAKKQIAAAIRELCGAATLRETLFWSSAPTGARTAVCSTRRCTKAT